MILALRWKWKLLAHLYFPCLPFLILEYFSLFPPWFFSQCLLFWRKCLRRNVVICCSKHLNMGITRASGGPADTALSPLGDAGSATPLGSCTASEIMNPCSLRLPWPVAHSWIACLTTAGSSNGCLLELTTFSDLPLRSCCLIGKSVLQHWPFLAVLLEIRFPWLCARAPVFPFLPLENSILHVLWEEYQWTPQNWASSFVMHFVLTHFRNSFSEACSPVHCMRGTWNGDGIGMLGLEIRVTLVFTFWEEHQCS